MKRLVWSLIRFLINRRLYQLTRRQPWHRRAAQEVVRQVYFGEGQR